MIEKKIFVVAVVLVIALITVFFSTFACAKETKKIVLLHTNDIHGHIFPYEFPELNPPPGKVGGFQYLATLIKSEREKNPGKILLLDGGDIAQGSMCSNLAYGVPVLETMNYLRYDATVIGNHEFDWGEKKLTNMIGTAEFPVLSSNVIMKKTGNFIKGCSPYTIKNINGVRIGIVGLTTTNTDIMGPSCEVYKYEFLSPEETLRKYMPLLKDTHKVDVLIVLSHLGFEKDKILAKNVPSIDVIVGAHSHTALQEPVIEGKTIILQAGNYMKYLGRFEFDFSFTEHKIVSYEGKLIKVIDNDIEPDREVSWMLDYYSEKYAPLAKEVIGKSSVDLIRNSWRESNIGNLFTDIIKETGNTDIGFINSKGIREDIPSGPVTMEEIYAAYPFDDILVSMEIKGKYILEILENSFDGKHSILQVSSGLKLKYDIKMPEGSRLLEAFYNGNPIDPEKVYTVTTINFLAAGGDGYDAFCKGENTKNLMSARDAFTEYFKMHKTVKSEVEGRIEVLN